MSTTPSLLTLEAASAQSSRQSPGRIEPAPRREPRSSPGAPGNEAGQPKSRGGPPSAAIGECCRGGAAGE